MATNGFDRIQAGTYIQHFAYGYKGIVAKFSGGWAACIYGPGDDCKDVRLSKECPNMREAMDLVNIVAPTITEVRKNSLTEKEFVSPITTPYACDPSYERYHCM